MAALSLGAYGKLPCSPEFLRHACYEGTAKLYRSWIDEGHDWLSQQHDAREVGDHAIALRSGQAPSESLIGIWQPSGDATGTRRFPFTLFARVCDDGPTKASDFAHASRLWSALRQQARGIAEANSADEFYQLAQNAHVELENSETPQERFDVQSAAAWIESLYPDRDSTGARRQWARGLWYLRSLAPAIRANKRAPLLEAYRVPLARSTSSRAQLEWWLRLLRSLGQPLADMPTVVVSESPQRLHFFWRELTAEDWGFVNSSLSVGDRVCDLTCGEVRLPQSGYSTFEQRIVEQSFERSQRVGDLARLEVLT